jgi:hypothetical protein
VRFASVYRQFEDVEAFHEEIERLRNARPPTAAARRPRGGRARAASRDQLPLLPEAAANDGPAEANGKK